jgi:hypothetical protein
MQLNAHPRCAAGAVRCSATGANGRAVVARGAAAQRRRNIVARAAEVEEDTEIDPYTGLVSSGEG